MTTNFLLSGFGGQGILFAGKQLAKTGMDMDLNVSWLPSYGPEMRGGAANCSVIISDKEIGAPIVTTPDVLVALNLPSFLKFEPAVKAGGILVIDSTLVDKRSERTDIKTVAVPATELAVENGLEGFANVIILGQLIKVTGLFAYDTFLDYLVGSIPPAKAALIEKNKKALAIGYGLEL